jgi:ADP-heptose:LPS heptosyltransferase
VLEFDAPWIDPDPKQVDTAAVARLVQQVWELKLDQAIILGSFHQSPLPLALLLRMAGIPHIAAASDDYAGSLLDLHHQVAGNVHEVERALSLVRGLGYRLPLGDRGTLDVRTTSLPAEVATLSNYVVVHPGASTPARAWPEERHTELVGELLRRRRHVVVTGGAHETGLAARVAAGHRGVIDLCGRTTFAELAGVLAGADAVVVANTMPAHLAAAVGTPVVSLFAPTVPADRWRPWMVQHELLGWQKAPCAGSRVRVCPIQGHPCLSRVTAVEVADALDRVARFYGWDQVTA